MSEKQVKKPKVKASARSPFQSGRPERITNAVGKKQNSGPDSIKLPEQRGAPTRRPKPQRSAKSGASQLDRGQISKNSSETLSKILSQSQESVKKPKAPQKPKNMAGFGSATTANDDIASAADLLEGIKGESSRQPIIAALVFTVIWVILCIAVGISSISSGVVDPAALSLTSLPSLIAVAAILLVPCVLSWGVAIFIWRARELHQISMSLAYTALHLTQPEDMAVESIASIGQAVRREVAAMGDGIDRAIGRATTLESKFRNEVGNIQGFYKNNENVFQKIIEDLQSERNQMITTSADLEKRLPTILDKLKESSFDFTNIVQSADKRFTSLAKTADKRLADLGDNIAKKNDILKSGIEETIEKVSGFNQKIDMSAQKLFAATDKFNSIGNSTTTKLEKIGSNFERQTQDLGHATQAILRANDEINNALKSRHESLAISSEKLVQNAEEINDVLGTFSSVMEQSFLNAEDKTKTIKGMLVEGANEGVEILDQEMNKIRNVTGNETKKLVKLLRESSFNATNSLRNDIHNILKGSQSEVQASLTMLLKESQSMSERLRDEADQITQMMQAQMENIQQSALGNTNESLALIKENHETAIADIVGQIDKAGERLNVTADSLNQVTARLDQEMAQTRHQLDDQVSKIPHEAKAALADMQNYVDEQVDALKTLSSTVGGFTTQMSIAEPMAPNANQYNSIADQNIAQTRPIATPAPAPAVAPQATPRAEPAVAAPKPQAAASAPNSRRESLRERLNPSNFRTEAKSARPKAQANPGLKREEAPKAAGQNKWQMPDLLSRASSDQGLPAHMRPNPAAAQPQQQQKPRSDAKQLHSVESLNAISLDLAKALDHKAPEELWARYRNGERNVFTRRLYTMRGQQLFDQVAGKYQADAGFRRDVDRYISDFEDLLTKIYEEDRDSMLIDTYLSSETGKIYLMLAHASGRLD